MRVLIIYGDYPPKPPGEGDGGADFVQRLAERLVTRGISVSVLVSSREGRDRAYVTERGVTVLPLVQDWAISSAVQCGMSTLRSAIRDRADVVHLVYPDPYLRYVGDRYHLPFLLKLAGARRLLTTFFGFGYTAAGLVSRIGLASLFIQSDRIVITDRALFERFRRTFPFWSGKVRPGVVGPIEDVAADRWSERARLRIRSTLGLPAANLVGFFGFWTPDKGLTDLLSACAKLIRDGKDLHLVLIGGREAELRTPFERTVIRRIEELGLRDHVRVTGPLPSELVARHLRALDVCALPFTVNPLGRSSLALALAVGVPTVVTRPPIAADEMLGLELVQPCAPDQLAASIDRVTSSPERRRQLSDAALTIAKRYSWDAIADEYVSDYQTLTMRP